MHEKNKLQTLHLYRHNAWTVGSGNIPVPKRVGKNERERNGLVDVNGILLRGVVFSTPYLRYYGKKSLATAVGPAELHTQYLARFQSKVC